MPSSLRVDFLVVTVLTALAAAVAAVGLVSLYFSIDLKTVVGASDEEDDVSSPENLAALGDAAIVTDLTSVECLPMEHVGSN